MVQHDSLPVNIRHATIRGMKNIGIIGWRGMVGSVLIERMNQENDFELMNSHFFSTSQAGQTAPIFTNSAKTLLDAFDLEQLSAMDIIISCQGGDYTKKVHPALRDLGWKGFWIDAASALRMEKSSVLVLDPVNKTQIIDSISNGTKDFIGSNCTVSPILMSLGGLFQEGLIEWVSSMTYQAASGAGAANITELLAQMKETGGFAEDYVASSPASSIVDLERQTSKFVNSDKLSVEKWPAPLAANCLPWIDSKMENGQTREEWKTIVEINKILGNSAQEQIPVDGTCVRIGALRCHSLALTVKLSKNIELHEIESIIEQYNEWTEVVPNEPEATVSLLTPAALSGSMKIRVGRLRFMNLGDTYLNAFVVGDQLLWGAAEPLRRTLRIILEEV